jgi:hypothetical protein
MNPRIDPLADLIAMPLPPLKTLQDRYLRPTRRPTVSTAQHALNDYDHLLKGPWAQAHGGLQ